MTAVYVLSDPDSVKAGKYKLGITSRTKEYLLRDYRRSRPEVILFFFENCVNARLIEDTLLNRFKEYRIPHESGKLSEWIIINVKSLINSINDEIKKLEKTEGKEITLNKEGGLKTEKYKPSDFIKEYCVFSRYSSCSCNDLYLKYQNIKTDKDKYNKGNFCKQVLYEIKQNYNWEIKDIKFKNANYIYYNGIKLRSDGSCIIL